MSTDVAKVAAKVTVVVLVRIIDFDRHSISRISVIDLCRNLPHNVECLKAISHMDNGFN